MNSTTPEVQPIHLQQQTESIRNKFVSSDIIQADFQCLTSYIFSHVK